MLSERQLSAVDLEITPPELGAPEPTELRQEIRPFPKDERERRCFQYLCEEMRASPARSPRKKADVKKVCKRRFFVTLDAFEYCWRESIKATGARWDQPGRRPR